jgi:hypothetical protein
MKIKFLFLLMLSLPAISAEKADDELDSVIDRLEAKLDGQRSSVLDQYKIVKKNAPAILESTSQDITSNLEETRRIDELYVATKKLESDLEQLSEKVNLQATQIQNDSKMLPRAKIVFIGPNAEKTRVKYLRITLNDIPLYEYNIANSSASFPQSFNIYEGTLPQGKHKLVVEGNWASLSNKLYSDDEVSWKINQNLELESSGSNTITTYALTAQNPTPTKRAEILLKVGSQP